MTISVELQAQILRYHHVEGWRVNTIARHLRVHHSTVVRVLAQAGVARAVYGRRASSLDTYVPFVMATLERFPDLTAASLYAMVRGRGYAGSASQFRHRIALLRPRPVAQAYLRLRTLPGEQMQVDWAHFGHLDIGRAKRALMAFVLVLSYSRRMYLRFFLDARLPSFLAGHVGAFQALGGLARVCLYDNLKSAVLERQGDAIRFNPALLAFAAHYRFEPRPVAPARGNEKGRVERAIRYVREAFFAGRAFANLADLNAQAMAWCEGPALERPWPEDRTLRVAQAFERERAHLLPLPEQDWPLGERTAVHIGKTPYARFDLNDYSIPHTHVRRTLSLWADTDTVRIMDGADVLATHARSYDRGVQVELPAHIHALVLAKRAARRQRSTDVLVRAIPSLNELLTRAAARGHNLGSISAAFTRLAQHYRPDQMELAVQDALARDVPHPNAVRLALQRQAGVPAALVSLPQHLQALDVPVQAHALSSYDQLRQHEETHDEQIRQHARTHPDRAQDIHTDTHTDTHHDTHRDTEPDPAA